MNSIVNYLSLCYYLTIFYFVVFAKVLFNLRTLQGFGLNDGEIMERLWSYLRPFGKITKEMTKANRLSLLEDALAYYGQRKMLRLGMHNYTC